jgi:hypothetical protein
MSYLRLVLFQTLSALLSLHSGTLGQARQLELRTLRSVFLSACKLTRFPIYMLSGVFAAELTFSQLSSFL